MFVGGLICGMVLKRQCKGQLTPPWPSPSFRRCCTRRQWKTYPVYFVSSLTSGCKFLRRAPFLDVVMQIHKDAIGQARRQVFPLNRAVNGLFHVREEETIAAECANLSQGKKIKEFFDWIMFSVCKARFAPHSVFFFDLTGYDDQNVVATRNGGRVIFVERIQFACPSWRSSASWRSLKDSLKKKKKKNHSNCLVFRIWVRLVVTSRLKPFEAIHSPWQRTLGAQSKVHTVSTILDFMQTIHMNLWPHSFDCSAYSAIAATSRIADPSLLHGTLLPRVGRTTPLSFATRSSSEVGRPVHFLFFAVRRSSDSELDLGRAQCGLNTLCWDS